LPFYKYSLIGTIVFGALLFGSYWLLLRNSLLKPAKVQ
jgi:hypothetical protein